MKICKSCGNQKHQRQNGQFVCKTCLNSRQTRYRSQNRVKVKEWAQNYKDSHSEILVARTKKRRNSSIRYWLSSKLAVIKSRGQHAISITTDDLHKLYIQQCGLCAISQLLMTTVEHDLSSVSIDRINSTLDYNIDNIQLIVKAINIGKKHHSDIRMREIINCCITGSNPSPPLKIISHTRRHRRWQQSIENFMRHKLKHLNDSHKYNYKKYGATRTITISYDLLMELWHKQNGRCNLSKLPMFNILDDPLTISIDRIDSDIDYVNGNIQLVCQWVNLAKRNEDNLAMVDFMNKLRQRLMT